MDLEPPTASERLSDQDSPREAASLASDRALSFARSLLWQRLRPRRRDTARFLRECLVLEWRVDFYCPEAGLVVLVESRRGAAKEARRRDRVWRKAGLQVLRISEHRVEADLDATAAEVLEALRLRLLCGTTVSVPAVQAPAH